MSENGHIPASCRGKRPKALNISNSLLIIMLLIDRKQELAWLSKAYKSKRAEFGIIYGRRRLGKTFLIKNFIKNKPHFYFLAKQQPMELEFERFKGRISRKFNVFLEAKTWEELFKEVADKIAKKGKKFIIIIDEFPYWILKDKGIVSEFQYLWDEILNKENIMLVFLGSYVSIMEQRVLSYKSPLYGRRTFQIAIKEMQVKYLFEFLKRYGCEDTIKVYGLADTIPYYLCMIDNDVSFKGNLRNLLSPNHPFYQDAEILLSSELREYNTYFNILKAILDGAAKLNEIAGRSRVDITNIIKYLNVLIGLRFLEKVKPVTSGVKEKNYQYRIKDNYLKFWLTYVYPYKEEIEESSEQHIDFIISDYPNYMGNIFEDFCRKYLRISAKFNFAKIGKWWHKDKEIDIVALNEITGEILFGECKWKERVNAEKIVKELSEKAGYVQWHNEKRKEHYAVFAKSFKRKVRELDGKEVYCFDLKDLETTLKPSSQS